TASTPEFVNYSTANGLASDAVWSITEDNSGRMYLATGRGLDRLDPQSGHIRHFGTPDGLAGDQLRGCMKDSQGNIWIATTTGLSRLNPRAEREEFCPPPVYLSQIQAAGEEIPIAETGRLSMTGLILPAAHNSLLIGFVGLDFQGVRELRYQYKLEGIDADWAPPTGQRSVNYARLTPGSYRFLVRAINKDGMTSPAPAVLEFRILRPVWQQWWFLTLASMAAGWAIYSIYRMRVVRFIEIASVRTRIASDLHDDIGANLSKIAVMSEVANQQLGSAYPGLEQPLWAIARISRESVASMSDVVWAINPARDSLVDLTRRMREFSSDTFTACSIAFEFRSPSATPGMTMGADLRRTVYLIFKEAVNNIVRHSGCTRAAIDIQTNGSWIELRVSDNGRGFDPCRIIEGNGLLNMRKRAERSGGNFSVSSSHRSGTTVALRLPVRRQTWTERIKNRNSRCD
ncbi:MAG TPA: triple tyrosine motif-containing protein, partial [Acidobacteriota bacterium]|nr:triple tyrosine motif-containing protein [Acidobacteriota bacterium]